MIDGGSYPDRAAALMRLAHSSQRCLVIPAHQINTYAGSILLGSILNNHRHRAKPVQLCKHGWIIHQARAGSGVPPLRLWSPR